MKEKIDFNYSDKGSKKLVVFFPPGVGDPADFNKLAKVLEQSSIVIKYPGISDTWKSGNLKTITQEIYDFLSKRNEAITLVGESYGGNIILELIKLGIEVENVIVLGTGEYFKDYQKPLLKVVSIPSKYSRIYRKLMAKAVARLGYFRLLRNLDDDKLKIVLKRWLEIIDYKIPDDLIYKGIFTFIYGNNDEFVRPESVEKLGNLIPQMKIVRTENSHTEYKRCYGGKLLALIIEDRD
ncbi:MAG TPA: alpha/beta hydrolase [Candidatus Woesebacteria bacterium]|nr:alpha/beta hydrolase [Candidatus Woesebacteria bacterium]